MDRMTTLSLIVLFVLGSVLLESIPGSDRTACAAESLKVDSLSSDPRQFRTQVAPLLAKADAMIEKLKNKPAANAIVLDLMQTRDNILREIAKIDGAPGDAKWTAKEMWESVQAMLGLLRDLYDKASAMAS